MKKYFDRFLFRVLDWLTDGALSERARLQVQLAGISVVAAGGDLDLPKTAWGWSPAFEDVRKLWKYTHTRIAQLEQTNNRQSFEIDTLAKYIKQHEYDVENLRNRLKTYEHIDNQLRARLRKPMENVTGESIGLTNC